MIKSSYHKTALTLALLVFAALLVTACQEVGPDPYQAGQLFREQVDRFLEEAGRFIAGFCSASLLPGVAVGLLMLGFGKRTH